MTDGSPPAAIAPRRRTARPAGAYSRLIAWAKIILPLAALVLISTVFLVTRDRGPDIGILFTEADFAALGDGTQMDNPLFSGVTREGDAFVLAADMALPDPDLPDTMVLRELAGEVAMSGGETLTIRAPRAVVDFRNSIVRVGRGAQLTSAAGYSGAAESLRADLAAGSLIGGAAILNGPLGQIGADSFRLDWTGDGNKVLTFTGSVRLTFDIIIAGEPAAQTGTDSQ